MSSRTEWPKVASYLLLEKNGKYMLVRRCNTGWHDGDFSLPAGHVSLGESAIEALIRESKEEVGVNLNKDDLELVHVVHRNKTPDNAEYIDLYFQTNNWSGKLKMGTSVDLIEWCKVDNLPQNIIPVVKEVLIKISKGILYSDTGFN